MNQFLYHNREETFQPCIIPHFIMVGSPLILQYMKIFL